MIRGARAGSAFLRSAATAGAAGRCSAKAPSAATRLGVVSRHQGHRHQWAFASGKGQARLLSAAPGSLDDTKDEPKPEGFMKRLLGKESCVVRVDGLLERSRVLWGRFAGPFACSCRYICVRVAFFGCSAIVCPFSLFPSYNARALGACV